MSDASKRKEKRKWAIEKPTLDNARKLHSIYFIDPADEEFKFFFLRKRAEKVGCSGERRRAVCQPNLQVQRISGQFFRQPQFCSRNVTKLAAIATRSIAVQTEDPACGGLTLRDWLTLTPVTSAATQTTDAAADDRDTNGAQSKGQCWLELQKVQHNIRSHFWLKPFLVQACIWFSYVTSFSGFVWFCLVLVSTTQFCCFPPAFMACVHDGSNVPVSPIPTTSSIFGSPHGSTPDFEGTGIRPSTMEEKINEMFMQLAQLPLLLQSVSRFENCVQTLSQTVATCSAKKYKC